MSGENKNLLRAAEILERVTPFSGRNCGSLCGAACCKGSDNDGMELFPGEYELLTGEKGFKFVESQGENPRRILVCSGECDRRKRPLACRFFPLFPLAVEHDGEIKIIPVPDPRAAVCPLISHSGEISKRFYRSVRLAGKYLIRDNECRDYLLNLSSELQEIANLAAKIV